MQNVIRALAAIAGVRIIDAYRTVRRHPVLGDEIHITEELAYLRENLRHYAAARHTLRSYPKLEAHMQQEQRLIIAHALGLVWRMAQNKPLPQPYSENDTKEAIKELCRLLIDFQQRTHQLSTINPRQYRILEPFMTLSQRRRFHAEDYAVVAYARALARRPISPSS